jgi:transcriptional regulator MraZ
VFLGTYAPRLDQKSRLVLPAKFRERLADDSVITRGQERCLRIRSLADFRSSTEQPRQALLTSKAVHDHSDSGRYHHVHTART